LGRGLALVHRPPVRCHRNLTNTIARLADAERITLDHAAFQSYASDSGASLKNGVPATLACYPTRYTHGPKRTAGE